MRCLFTARMVLNTVVATMCLAVPAAIIAAQPLPDESPSDNVPPASATDDPFRDDPPIDEPRPPQPTVQPSRPSNSLLGARQPIRASRTPAMFGDFFAPGGSIVADIISDTFFADVPIGGGRHAKVSENNQALTDDRCYVSYNHFHNALAVNAPPQIEQLPVDRVQFGFEKSFRDRLWSVELRLPLVSTFSVEPPGAEFGISGKNVGNVAVILKRMLFEGNNLAVAGGLGIDVPTSGDVTGFIGPDLIAIRNDAFHLLPYAGLVWTPCDSVFVHSFAQLDLAANGNRVELQGSQVSGVFTEQNLFMFDVSAGIWLDRNPRRNLVTGIAALFELHYTTSMQQADLVFLNDQQDLVFLDLFGPGDFGVLNFTAGLHVELENDASLRLAAVLPVKQDPNRFFDAELFVSFIKQL